MITNCFATILCFLTLIIFFTPIHSLQHGFQFFTIKTRISRSLSPVPLTKDSFHFSEESRALEIKINKLNAQKDEFGYEVKDRSWFEGLSTKIGGSLTDPRALPKEAKEFADKVKSGYKVSTIDESLQVIDLNFDYIAVPFSNGDIVNEPNTNTGTAKILSYGLLAGLDIAQTLSLFGNVYEDVLKDPSGVDHQNIRNFLRFGWSGVKFSSGLAILSKIQAYDDTDAAMSTQSSIEGEAGWDIDSDSWIP